VKFRLLALAALLAAGCDPSMGPSALPAGAATTNAAAATEPVFYLDHAQSGLPRVKLWLGAKEITAELCHTVPQIATGLMHRRGIGPEETMLFVFASEQRRAFYMRNVPFDIDVAYIDGEGVIREIVRLVARDEKGVPSKSDGIQFVLEAAPDFFTSNGLGPGTQVQTDQGPLRQKLAGLAQLR
jgi:uncharacterized membrane protein (UPF0127 family)